MFAVAVGKGYVARGMWPNGIGYRKDSGDLDNEMLHLPLTWDGMAEKFQIEAMDSNTGDPTRGLSLHVRDSTDRGPLHFRLWGFVKECAMGATGNWDGKKENAPRAKQYIVLESSGCLKAFEPQVKAVKHIRDFVFAELGGPKEAPLINTLYLQHRIFRKTRGNERGQSVRYVHGEDPTGIAVKISEDWRIAHKPIYQRQQSDGSVVRTSAVTIRPGDFVETRVVADIVYKRHQGKEANLVRVNFQIVDATRLYSESQLNEMKIPAALKLIAEPAPSTAQVRVSQVAGTTTCSPQDHDGDEEMA